MRQQNGAQGWADRLLGPPDTRRMVRENLRDPAAFTAAGRLFMRHPVTLYTYLLPLTLLVTGLLRPEYTRLGLSDPVSHLLTTAKIAAYWGLCWVLLGPLASLAMRRGAPFALVPVGMWVVAVLGSELLSLLLIPGFEWSNLRLFRQAMLTVPSTLVAVHATAPLLRERLGQIPDLVPIWSPRVKLLVPLLLKLPPDRRGRLRRIHAANQYVEVVTEAGTTLLRLSLRDATALVPEGKGWLCHRSLWIRKDEVVALTYQRGQPQITDRDGRIWPISRSAAPEIRDWLNLAPVEPSATDAEAGPPGAAARASAD